MAALDVRERAPGVIRFSVRVIPRASTSRVEGARDGVLRIRLSAPPVAGAANAALLTLLAEALGVRPRAVVLVAGEVSRTKVVEVTGTSVDRVLALG